MNHADPSNPPNASKHDARALLPCVALALLGVALFVAAMWLISRDPAWRLGQAIWPAGIGGAGWALPMGVSRGLTWALLAAWLGLGPAALVRAARPWAWLVALGVSAAVLLLAGWWWVLLPVLVGFVAAFDPRWLPRDRLAEGAEPELVFYDGGCGFCHKGVRRLALADAGSGLFRFAPLEGHTAMKALTPAQRDALPDSIVVRTHRGKLLTRSAAVVHLCGRLGGWYRVGAWALRGVPRPVRDFAYARVAAARHKLSKKPGSACPMMPAGLRDRFLG